MIARILIWIILLIVLPDFYLDRYLQRKYGNITAKKRLLWWMPAVTMLVYTILLASTKNFAPDNLFWIRAYLFLAGLFVAPKAVFAFFSLLGWLWARYRHQHKNYGDGIGLLVIPICWILFFYGLFVGWRHFVVKHIDLYVDDLPASFEGYRMVHFSDAHLGSFTGSAVKVLKRDVDSINAQHADMIAFTGDLQDIQPSELPRFKSLMASLHAPDGVYSILGNHDYSTYVGGTPSQKKANERETCRMEQLYGWKLLKNQHAWIARGKDTLYIAGEENHDIKPIADKDDETKTYQGIPLKAFVICLQHNPLLWEESLVSERPRAIARLTLSGHTHAGQISLFGLRPTMLQYKYDYGLYERQNRFLNVSGGIGGLVLFRLGATPEISVITLHQKHETTKTTIK